MTDDDVEFEEGCPDCGRDSVVLKVYGSDRMNWCDCGWWEPAEESDDV